MRWFAKHIFAFFSGTSLILMMIGNMRGKELSSALFGFIALCCAMFWFYEQSLVPKNKEIKGAYDRSAYYQARRKQIKIVKGNKK